VAIDFERSRILAQSDSCPNLVCEDDLVAYQNEILPTGRDELIKFAREAGIIEQVVKDGGTYYSAFLRSLGFDEVRVIVDGYGLQTAD